MTTKRKAFSARDLRLHANPCTTPTGSAQGLEQVILFKKENTQKALSTVNAYATHVQGAAQEDIRISKLKPPQILSSKPRFVKMLMSSGEKNRAYQILLASISTCKSKMLEKKSFVHKDINTKDYTVAPSKENENRIPYTQIQRPKLYHMHTGVQQATGITELASFLQSRGMQKRHSKKCLQSDQVCSKTAHSVEPIVETRKVRVRGSTYQVPSALHSRRRERMAVSWVITNARIKRESRKEALSRSLGQELFDCINKRSVSIQRRDQMYKLAANNRVYMRYKWW